MSDPAAGTVLTLIVAEAVAIVVLGVLVFGLLRSHAERNLAVSRGRFRAREASRWPVAWGRAGSGK